MNVGPMSARQQWRVTNNSQHYPTLAQRLGHQYLQPLTVVSKFSVSFCKLPYIFLFFPAKPVFSHPTSPFGTLDMAKTSHIIEKNVGYSLVCWKKLKALSLVLTQPSCGTETAQHREFYFRYIHTFGSFSFCFNQTIVPIYLYGSWLVPKDLYNLKIFTLISH